MTSKDKIGKKKFSKKGLILTVIIAIGIIGASSLVWVLPSGNVQKNGIGNMTISFSNSNETLISVNTQFASLKDEVKTQVNEFKMNPANVTHFTGIIDTSLKQNDELMQTLLHGNPSPSLESKYIQSMNTMKNFSSYLSEIKNISTKSSNKSKDLEIAEKKWQIN